MYMIRNDCYNAETLIPGGEWLSFTSPKNLISYEVDNKNKLENFKNDFC